MKLQNHELAFIQLGFRISQLLEIYGRAYIYLSATARIVPRLAARLNETVEVCPFAQSDATEIHRIVELHSALLQNAEMLLESIGTPQFFEELLGASCDLELAVRTALRKDRHRLTCFEIGVLLAKSDGGPTPLVTGTSNSQPTWRFRHPVELRSALLSLELKIEQISGLPDDVAAFVVGLLPSDQRFSRYPQDRWGWSFIEDQMVSLSDGLELDPQSDGDARQNDREPETEDDLLAMYLDGLTGLQADVVQVLWNRKYPTAFDTLRSTAWKTRRPVSDVGIEKLLVRIRKKWTKLAFGLQISMARKTVKLIRPDSNAAG